MIRKFLILAIIVNISMADKFTWDFYKEFAKTRTTDNFLISPASLSLVLGMAKEGAVDETKNELTKGLGDLNFASLSNKLKSDQSLKSGNKIFIGKDFTIKQSYTDTIRDVYQTKSESVDFTKKDETATKINKFIEKSTEGLLKNVVTPSSISSDMTMVLINTIFFKGTWVNGFKLLENPRSFYFARDNKVPMYFMDTDELKFNYVKNYKLKFEAIELPYEGTDLKMVILLPDYDISLRALEEKFNETLLEETLRSMELKDAYVTMPKIKIDSDFSCIEELKQLGMKKMFSDRAEFSEFVTQPIGMKVSDVHQKAVIDINEHGTIAAVASEVQFTYLCLDCGPVDFAVNRPFLFLIKDKDFVYFMGRVYDPRK